MWSSTMNHHSTFLLGLDENLISHLVAESTLWLRTGDLVRNWFSLRNFNMVLIIFIVQYVNTETALFGSSDSIQCFVIKGRWVSWFLRWPVTMGASMPWCLCTKAEFRLGKTADMCGLWPVSPLKWPFFSLAPALTLRCCSKVLLPTLLQILWQFIWYPNYPCEKEVHFSIL